MQDTSAKPLPDPPAPKLTRVQEHLANLKEKRYTAIAATIPAAIPGVLASKYRAYAWLCVAHLGRRRLARVHWPWNEQPRERVKRGNPRRNPKESVCNPSVPSCPF